MNEQSNTRLVQQAYQSIKQNDLQALLHLLATDVQWQLPDMKNVPFAGTWQGREGVAQFFHTVNKVQATVAFEPQEFITQEDKVVVLGRFVMRIKATGRTARSDWAHVWTFKAG